MKLRIKKSIIVFLSVMITALALCLPAAAAGERQNVHIKTPGITVEIPGDAQYTVNEAETGEMLTASDTKETYTITLVGEKSNGDVFNYKDLKKDEIEQVKNKIQSDRNADKVTAYETNQAIFFDCINNAEKYLCSITIVNGYEYVLKLAAGNRELTISDHGIFNTAARSIVFDNVENKPAEVNVLGTVGTIICIGIVILVVVIISVIFIRRILIKRRKSSGNLKDGGSHREQIREERQPAENAAADDSEAARAEKRKAEPTSVGEAPLEVMRSVKTDRPQHQKSRKKDYGSDNAAESFYEEIESDGLFEEQAEEDMPTQVQMGYINNVPGDEEYENTPVRMRVDIIKPVGENGENSDQSDLLELSRNNNEDYDEAATDDYSDGREDEETFGRPRAEKSTAARAGAKAARNERQRRERPERTEEERQQAAERRRRREAQRSERRESYSDSEYVKSFDSDSYWDKYR